MSTRQNLILTLIIGSWLATTSITAPAMQPANITPAEMVVLPRYCPDTQTFKASVDSSDRSPSTLKWLAVMDRNFWHMHHYCWALINIRRAERTSTPGKQKLAMLEEARGDLGYLLANVQNDFVLLPEILTWKGRVHILLNEPQPANEAFARARLLKPDYWPPYLRWAEYLSAKGRKAEAMAIVRSGLQYSPEAKPLLILYQELGGKPTDMPPRLMLAKPDDTEQPAADRAAEPAPTPAAGYPK